ncbi:RidA family protein [Paenibacillus sp. PAMC21692]|uniref:RidA family protein n=1 Tax=Paenibacillus sp. PAMC21692 TaxID=2762320 RepID=UPI00164CFCA3|nr:RidA family protein [Paenibacillus sp. PAMC21692]QNK58593.1 RidA family protein [Paenibacillus sp. PAMC21692]
MTSIPKVLPFSSSSRIGDSIFVSGQGGLDPQTGAVVGPALEEQTVQTMENILAILRKDNLDFCHVKKVNIYLSRRDLYKEFNEIYARYFTAPYPARTTIYCDLNYDLLVEIDVVAEISNGTT